METKLGLRIASAIVGVLLIAGTVGAQETVNYASVRGQVIDPQGGSVPGAVVTARQIDTNVSSEMTTPIRTPGCSRRSR